MARLVYYITWAWKSAQNRVGVTDKLFSAPEKDGNRLQVLETFPVNSTRGL